MLFLLYHFGIFFFIFKWKICSFVNSRNTEVSFLGICTLKFASCLEPATANEGGACVVGLFWIFDATFFDPTKRLKPQNSFKNYILYGHKTQDSYPPWCSVGLLIKHW